MQFTLTSSSNSAQNSQFSVFKFGDQQIRVVEKDGEPWFVAVDICRALNLQNPTKSLKVLASNEKDKADLNNPNFKLGYKGNLSEINIVSESGLYVLILRCKDAVTEGSPAYNFRLWVTQEVLPAIRKTGKYHVDEPRFDKDGRCPHCGLRPIPSDAVVLESVFCDALLNVIYLHRYLFRDCHQATYDFLARMKSPLAPRYWEMLNDTTIIGVEQRLANKGYCLNKLPWFREWMASNLKRTA